MSNKINSKTGTDSRKKGTDEFTKKYLGETGKDYFEGIKDLDSLQEKLRVLSKGESSIKVLKDIINQFDLQRANFIGQNIAAENSVGKAGAKSRLSTEARRALELYSEAGSAGISFENTQKALKSFNVPKSDALLAWENVINIDPTENISGNPGLLTQSSNNGGIIEDSEAGLKSGSASSKTNAEAEILNDIDSEKNLINDKPDADNDGAGETFTQGSKIPDELLETKPPYSPAINRWLEDGGKIEINDSGTWKYTNSQGVSVTYKSGYHDFKGSGHVVQEVDIGPFRERSTDFRLADQLAPNGPKSPLDTWHHNEDGRTLQEVNRDIHRTFTHKGGFSIVKRGGK